MIVSFIFAFLLINIGGAFGGIALTFPCDHDGSVSLEGSTVDITSSGGQEICLYGSCAIWAGLNYTLKFTTCSQGLDALNATRIPLQITENIHGLLGLNLIAYSYPEIDLCSKYTAGSETQSCPVTVDACGTYQFEIQAPVLVLPGELLFAKSDLIVKVWINEVRRNPALCFRIPLLYSLISI